MGVEDRLNRSLDRSMAHSSRWKNTEKVVNRADKEPVPIYMLPIIETEETKLHCIFCGHPFCDVRNKVMYVSTFPPHTFNKVASDKLHCKRCKQRYIKIV